MRIYKRGSTYWTEFIVDNKRYQLSCKTKDKNLAGEIAAALQADVVRNKFNIPQKYKSEKKFISIFEEYLKTADNSKKTFESKKDASKHFLPIFKDKNIINITVNDIKTYQLRRRLEIMSLHKNIGKKDSGISFRSVNLETTTLHHFFNYCIELDYLDKNPATSIKKLNELSRLKTLSDGDINKLIAGATNKLTRDLITFLIYTGCRKGEALNLKWDDVDLKNDVIAIKETKTKYDRYIPISKPLKALLSGVEKNQGFYMSLIETGAN